MWSGELDSASIDELLINKRIVFIVFFGEFRIFWNKYNLLLEEKDQIDCYSLKVRRTKLRFFQITVVNSHILLYSAYKFIFTLFVFALFMKIMQHDKRTIQQHKIIYALITEAFTMLKCRHLENDDLTFRVLGSEECATTWIHELFPGMTVAYEWKCESCTTVDVTCINQNHTRYLKKCELFSFAITRYFNSNKIACPWNSSYQKWYSLTNQPYINLLLRKLLTQQ